jgi:hypothetical protein
MSSVYDILTDENLKELPISGIKYLTQLFSVLPHLDARET